jgi:hypothetical protein
MDESKVTIASEHSTDVASPVEELAEFEFAPLTPSEEVDTQDQILIVGMAPCR